MANALASGDKATALQYLSDKAKKKYGPVFDALMPSMASIVGSFSPPLMSSISASSSEYAIVCQVNGVNELFFVYFEQGSNGLWRISGM